MLAATLHTPAACHPSTPTAAPARGRHPSLFLGPSPSAACALRSRPAAPRGALQAQQAVGPGGSSHPAAGGRPAELRAQVVAEATLQAERPTAAPGVEYAAADAAPRPHVGPPAYVKATGRVVASERPGRAGGRAGVALPPRAASAAPSASAAAGFFGGCARLPSCPPRAGSLLCGPVWRRPSCQHSGGHCAQQQSP